MVTLTHPFVSGKADGTDVTLVKPTNWNAEHKFETAADNILLGRAVGTGPGPVQELPFTSVFPTGMIMPFAGNFAPAGWMGCQGQSLLRVDYPALFAAIGSVYGAVDAAHFSLPDLRGRVIAGVDAGAGRLGSWVQPWVGGVGGQESVQYYADVSVSGGIDGSAGGTLSVGGTTAGASSFVYGLAFGGSGTAAQEHTHTWGWSGAVGFPVSGTFSGTGGGYTRAATNAQPTIVLLYLIKT